MIRRPRPAQLWAPGRSAPGRREFLASLSATGLALAGATSSCARRRVQIPDTVFTLGVASGDPVPDGVVLWTRLAPDPLHGGGMPEETVAVRWEVFADDSLTTPVRSGTVSANPELGHAVHVELEGLEPARWYWYRFHAGDETSPVGRTRTAAAPGSPVDRVRFAFVSCQHYEQGLYTAYEHLAAEDLDLVFHLGDYIYENGGISGRTRRHPGREIRSLEDYRNRYALYRLDPLLQVAHAAFPFVVTWDDHEVDNNYASAVPEDDQPVDAFLARRANAYQAYYEVMPLRASAMPRGPDMRLYRVLDVGTLARFYVLDTRQYRSDQPCGDGIKRLCQGVYDPGATMLGAEQEQWLAAAFAASEARWNALAQQVPVGRSDRDEGPGVETSMDKWPAYKAAHDQLLGAFASGRVTNPVVLTGDVHTNWVYDLRTDFGDPSLPVVGTEFVGTSISSGGDGGDGAERRAAMMSHQPHLKYFNAERGYARCEVTPDRWTSDFRTVPYVTRPGAPIRTRATFVVENGRAGAQEA